MFLVFISKVKNFKLSKMTIFLQILKALLIIELFGGANGNLIARKRSDFFDGDIWDDVGFQTNPEFDHFFEILEQSLFSNWEKEEAENLLESLQNSNHRFRRSINSDLLKKLLLIQAFSKRSRSVYQSRPVIQHVPFQNSEPLKKDEKKQLIDETTTADSRKTRQSAPVFDNTLFMVLDKVTKDGKFSQQVFHEGLESLKPLLLFDCSTHKNTEVARCRREQQEILIVLIALQTSNPAMTLQKYGLLPFGEQKNFKKIISEK
ncbi:unnamed protein product [Oikopleura dioica]|uniref:Uncharacterized protein n=1 Tax=Oikopleura dioica TaxID=34765 RepID=E4YKQ3_OIKDI|nr:unnamed protein product [Oikopleura dioica]